MVINLAPHNAENALDNEPALIKALGMQYIHIPVNFLNPSESDFTLFIAAMQSHESKRIWLHCAANMRASAFLFRYRRDVLKENQFTAKIDLEKIWQPLGAWKTFIDK